MLVTGNTWVGAGNRYVKKNKNEAASEGKKQNWAATALNPKP